MNDYSSGDYKQYSLSTLLMCPCNGLTAGTADLDAPPYYNIIFNGTGSSFIQIQTHIVNMTFDGYDIRTQATIANT